MCHTVSLAIISVKQAVEWSAITRRQQVTTIASWRSFGRLLLHRFGARLDNTGVTAAGRPACTPTLTCTCTHQTSVRSTELQVVRVRHICVWNNPDCFCNRQYPFWQTVFVCPKTRLFLSQHWWKQQTHHTYYQPSANITEHSTSLTAFTDTVTIAGGDNNFTDCLNQPSNGISKRYRAISILLQQLRFCFALYYYLTSQHSPRRGFVLGGYVQGYDLQCSIWLALAQLADKYHTFVKNNNIKLDTSNKQSGDTLWLFQQIKPCLF